MALVLSRKIGQYVRIILPNGDQIRIGIGDHTEPKHIKLMFIAKEDIKILREELLSERIQLNIKDPQPSGDGI